VATAVERRTLSQTVAPDPDQIATYEDALAEFTRYYDHMLGYWS